MIKCPALGKTKFIKFPSSRAAKDVKCLGMPGVGGMFKLRFDWYISIRLHLYGLGYRGNPPPRVTLAEETFSLFLSKLQPTVYFRNVTSSREKRPLGWASCLTSAGRVILASGTTFLHINALARLPGTVLGVASVT